MLSDVGNHVARSFGLVFSLAEELRPIYKQIDAHLPDFDGDESWELPIPATYILDRDGTVIHAFVNADYTRRMEPEEIVQILEKEKWKVSKSHPPG